jgi:Uncharacterized conserved protein
MDKVRIYDGFIPGKHPIDAYGDGGFRFADMSHRGSIVILPSGIHAWKRDEKAEVTAASLEADFDLILPLITKEASEIDLFLIGTGERIILPPALMKAKLQQAGLTYETMQTGPALRTYNVLFEEQRRLALAVIAVSN